MLLKDFRKQIVEVGHRMQAAGLAHDGQGNISMFDRQSGMVAITPSAVPYDARTHKDICVIDLKGSVVEGRWKPTSELALHLIFYRRSAEANAVVHTHAPYATVFGIIGEDHMPVVLNEAAMGLGGPLPVARYARPGTEELAEVTFDAGKDAVGAIMAHHGLLTFGTNLEAAIGSTLAAEATARIIVLARSMGVQPIAIDAAEACLLRQGFLQAYHPERRSR